MFCVGLCLAMHRMAFVNYCLLLDIKLMNCGCILFMSLIITKIIICDNKVIGFIFMLCLLPIVPGAI